jgi:hypothetical protein
VLQVISGTVRFSADAGKILHNLAFLFKMAMLVIGLVNVAAFHWYFGGTLNQGAMLPPRARMLAAVSLASWVLVLLAGRSTAYVCRRGGRKNLRHQSPEFDCAIL